LVGLIDYLDSNQEWEGEADSCGKMAVRVRKEVEDWIRKSHADKIG
jgi:hypothetical protein